MESTRKTGQIIYGDDENVYSGSGLHIQLSEVEWYRHSPPSHDLGFDSIIHAGRREKVDILDKKKRISCEISTFGSCPGS